MKITFEPEDAEFLREFFKIRQESIEPQSKDDPEEKVLALIRRNKGQRMLHHMVLKYSHLSVEELSPIIARLTAKKLIFVNRRKYLGQPGKIGTEYIAA